MSESGPEDARPYYGRARIIGGLALLAGGVLLALIDAFSETYAVDNVVLGLMLGTGVILLGAEAAAKRVLPGGSGDG